MSSRFIFSSFLSGIVAAGVASFSILESLRDRRCIGSSLLVEKEEALIMSRIYRAKLNEKIREVNQPSAIDSFMAENSRILIRLISAATKYVAVEIKMLTSSLSDSISKSLANSGIQIPGFNSSYDSTAATDSSGNKSDSSKSTDNGSSSDSNSSSSTKK